MMVGRNLGKSSDFRPVVAVRSSPHGGGGGGGESNCWADSRTPAAFELVRPVQRGGVGRSRRLRSGLRLRLADLSGGVGSRGGSSSLELVIRGPRPDVSWPRLPADGRQTAPRSNIPVCVLHLGCRGSAAGIHAAVRSPRQPGVAKSTDRGRHGANLTGGAQADGPETADRLRFEELISELSADSSMPRATTSTSPSSTPSGGWSRRSISIGPRCSS